MSDLDVQWCLFFIFVVCSYGYIIWSARIASKDDSQEHDLALLFFPDLGGYNTKRGDTQSDSLFQWNWTEILWVSIIGIFTIALLVFVWKRGTKHNTSHIVIIMQFLLIWTQSIILLLFVPVNPFHLRMLYNARAAAVKIVNHPQQGIFWAFLFLILLPLPYENHAKNTNTEKVMWLTFKLGVLYMIQHIFLGNPHYKIEPASDEQILANTKSKPLQYALLCLALYVIYRGARFDSR